MLVRLGPDVVGHAAIESEDDRIDSEGYTDNAGFLQPKVVNVAELEKACREGLWFVFRAGIFTNTCLLHSVQRLPLRLAIGCYSCLRGRATGLAAASVSAKYAAVQAAPDRPLEILRALADTGTCSGKAEREVHKFIARSSTQPDFLIRTFNPRCGVSHWSIHAKGMWEPHIYSRLRRVLVEQNACNQSGVQFVDLGCNVGFFSLYALSSGCEVLAVDGSSDLLWLLKSSLTLNSNPWNDGVSPFFKPDRLRIRRLFLSDSDSGAVDYKYNSYETNVPVRSIDRLFAEENLLKRSAQIPLVKLDIEDSVVAALRGATSMFKRHRVKLWLIEVWCNASSMKWLIHSVVLQGYSGTITAHAVDKFAARSEEEFTAAWAKGCAADRFVDAVFESELDAPLW
eukprot:CAMPEP_0117580894 /NCGR_PEP_ID=MMETSP0784-20121206/65490_1 /TAXON_ID=39447 /ORGANISM="" /LENGTH=397 /DNA_ID=CAMNT_0005381075 /DNA_START=110 /DNA_END=1301 /DNA_ORIENTATION=+